MTEAQIECVSRRAARREERREAILAISRRHFQERGYDGVSMSAIAAELGGSKGTLWSYFGSKEELFSATLESLIDEFAPMLELDPAEPLEPALLRYARHFEAIMLVPEVIALNRLVISEGTRFPELARVFWEKGPLRRHRTLARFFAAKMESGEMRRFDPMQLSSHFHHLCYHRLVMLRLWCVKSEVLPDAEEEDIALSLRVFLHGVAPLAA